MSAELKIQDPKPPVIADKKSKLPLRKLSLVPAKTQSSADFQSEAKLLLETLILVLVDHPKSLKIKVEQVSQHHSVFH